MANILRKESAAPVPTSSTASQTTAAAIPTASAPAVVASVPINVSVAASQQQQEHQQLNKIETVVPKFTEIPVSLAAEYDYYNQHQHPSQQHHVLHAEMQQQQQHHQQMYDYQVPMSSGSMSDYNTTITSAAPQNSGHAYPSYSATATGSPYVFINNVTANVNVHHGPAHLQDDQQQQQHHMHHQHQQQQHQMQMHQQQTIFMLVCGSRSTTAAKVPATWPTANAPSRTSTYGRTPSCSIAPHTSLCSRWPARSPTAWICRTLSQSAKGGTHVPTTSYVLFRAFRHPSLRFPSSNDAPNASRPSVDA